MKFIKARIVSRNNGTVSIFYKGVKIYTLNSLAMYSKNRLKVGRNYIFGIYEKVIFNIFEL